MKSEKIGFVIVCYRHEADSFRECNKCSASIKEDEFLDQVRNY
jgi:hypothetical protein